MHGQWMLCMPSTVVPHFSVTISPTLTPAISPNFPLTPKKLNPNFQKVFVGELGCGKVGHYRHPPHTTQGSCYPSQRFRPKSQAKILNSRILTLIDPPLTHEP